MQVFWFIPTTGDGCYLGDNRNSRETNLPYLQRIATAVDELGLEGVLGSAGVLVQIYTHLECGASLEHVVLPKGRESRAAIRDGIVGIGSLVLGCL
jgi:hypothetical protein